MHAYEMKPRNWYVASQECPPEIVEEHFFVLACKPVAERIDGESMTFIDARVKAYDSLFDVRFSSHDIVTTASPEWVAEMGVHEPTTRHIKPESTESITRDSDVSNLDDTVDELAMDLTAGLITAVTWEEVEAGNVEADAFRDGVQHGIKQTLLSLLIPSGRDSYMEPARLHQEDLDHAERVIRWVTPIEEQS